MKLFEVNNRLELTELDGADEDVLKHVVKQHKMELTLNGQLIQTLFEQAFQEQQVKYMGQATWSKLLNKSYWDKKTELDIWDSYHIFNLFYVPGERKVCAFLFYRISACDSNTGEVYVHDYPSDRTKQGVGIVLKDRRFKLVPPAQVEHAMTAKDIDLVNVIDWATGDQRRHQAK